MCTPPSALRRRNNRLSIRFLTLFFALLVCAPARSQGATSAHPGCENSTRLRAFLSGGVLGGRGVRPESLPALRMSVTAAPRLLCGALRVEVPATISHRQTFGGNLSEARASVTGRLRWKSPQGMRVGVDLGLLGVLRPGWADLYQPLGRGSFEPTYRYSYWGPRLRARIGATPLPHHAVRAAIGAELSDYRQDPAYDPKVPTHLVPGDQHRFFAEVGWHYLRHHHRSGLGLTVSSVRFSSAYARDAGTGKTHAAPGGPQANPLQHFLVLEPSLDYRWKQKRGVLRRVAVRYRHEVQIDSFDGYYSYGAPTPSLRVKLKPAQGLRVHAEIGASLRRYGRNSYQAGGSHPALDSGNRRFSNLAFATVGASLRLRRGLYLTLALKGETRGTNFPDYQPGIYPAARAYELDWDYTTFWAFGGVRYGHRFGD